MGANAQTTVPTFTAGQVLTAAQMNNSARTGVPVFADTTARDAGFGGTGEKTLAEGQLAYIESLDVVQYYSGASWLTLGPTNSGLTVVKAETAFSGVTSVTADNVFSASYTNYVIVIRATYTTAGVINYQLRVGGVTAATNYDYQYMKGSSTTISGARATGQTSAEFGAIGENMSVFTLWLSGPALAESTTGWSTGSYSITGGIQVWTEASRHSTATAYDGIIFTGGTMTGSYTIYGLGKTV